MSLAATILQEFRIPYKDTRLDKFEHKMGSYGICELAKSDTPNLLTPQQIEQARTSPTRAVKIPVIQRGSVTIKNVRSCNISAGTNTSALLPVTFKTYVADIEQIPAEFDNNEIGKQEDFNRKMENALRDMKSAIELDGYAALEAAKSQVNNGGGNYALTGNALQIPKADEHLFNELDAILTGNKFKGPWKVVANPYMKARTRKFYAQGFQNDENTQYQFDDWMFGYSHEIVPDTATVGQEKEVEGFVLPEGSIGMITWVHPEFKRNSSTGDKQWMVGANMPILGEDVGIFYKKDCVDKSAELGAGNENVMVEQWQISLDVAFVTAYNSDPVTEPSPIFKFEIPQA